MKGKSMNKLTVYLFTAVLLLTGCASAEVRDQQAAEKVGCQGSEREVDGGYLFCTNRDCISGNCSNAATCSNG